MRFTHDFKHFVYLPICFPETTNNMAGIKIYFLSFEAIPLRAKSSQTLYPNGLARIWIQAKGPEEALLCAKAHLVQYGLSPRSMEQPPIETAAANYANRHVDLANFRKAERFGIALHLEAHDPAP